MYGEYEKKITQGNRSKTTRVGTRNTRTSASSKKENEKKRGINFNQYPLQTTLKCHVLCTYKKEVAALDYYTNPLIQGGSLANDEKTKTLFHPSGYKREEQEEQSFPSVSDESDHHLSVSRETVVD